MQKIHVYAQQGDIAGIARKIANGVDIDRLDEYSQQTPLIIAAEYGATDCVRILLEAGANPSIINHCNDKAINRFNLEQHYCLNINLTLTHVQGGC